MSPRHLISIDDLSVAEMLEIFRMAEALAPIHDDRRSTDLLNGKILATLFYEPSTRTRLSFETAMLRMGGQVVSVPDMRSSSSAVKGETLADTATVISQYADLVALRHPLDGAARVAADHSTVPIVNAGDGAHEHPTQTLCDLYTLIKEKGDLSKEKGGIENLTVALCGDLRFGRTVHSLAAALARFGVDLYLIPAPGLDMPEELLRKLAIKHSQKFARVSNLDFSSNGSEQFDAVYMTADTQRGLFDSPTIHVAVEVERSLKFDVLYVTRQQKERLGIESKTGRAGRYPKLDAELLRGKRLRDAIVMHPLPRVDEIPPELDRDPRSKYFTQVQYGVRVRMALLAFLLREQQAGQPEMFDAPIVVAPSPIGYDSRDRAAEPTCKNDNCVTRHDLSVSPAFSILTREKTYVSHVLILECRYCASEAEANTIGNRRTRKFCAYDPSMEDLITEWSQHDSLILFKGAAEAAAAGFSPYAQGPTRRVMGPDDVRKAIEKLGRQIVSGVDDLSILRLVGLRSRGDLLAKRIADFIRRESGAVIPVGSLDVLPFRDDVHAPSEPAETLEFSIEGKDVVLVDDVLYSGRTTRAAMAGLMSGQRHGRPRRILAAFLVDRGHREVPIDATFVGKHLPTSTSERVRVRLREAEERDEVVVYTVVADEARATA